MKQIDLMIIGAQKAGTTALKNYLNEHPEILGHEPVEFDYFRNDESFGKPFDEEFKRQFTSGDPDSAKAVVAKNVGIYDNEIAIKRLYEHNSGCKLVLVIREPVSRAYSAYTMEKFNGWMKREFEDVRSAIEKKRYDDVMYHLFIRMGIYSELIKVLFRYFPKDQMRIVLFEDLKHDPTSVCRNLFEWIGVDKSFVPDIQKAYNVSRKARSAFVSDLLMKLRDPENPLKRIFKSILPYRWFTRIGDFLIESNKSKKGAVPMSPQLHDFLHDYFRPYNEELERMTGMDLSLWNNRH